MSESERADRAEDLARELYEELIALRQELDAARSEAAHEAAFSTYYTRPMKELTERVADEMYPGEGKPGHFHGGGSPATLRYERELGPVAARDVTDHR